MIRRTAVLVAAAALLLTPGGVLAEPDVDAGRLMADLEALAHDDMQGRGLGQPGGLRAREYVVRGFAESGLTPAGVDGWLQPFTARATRRRTKPAAAANVVGRLDGAEVNDRCLVVTAHYDHEGVRDGQIYNGADDNASGVAALFELARLFAAAPARHCLLFVAMDAEEAGLLGAEAFVASPPMGRAALAFNLNLDMISRGDNGRLWAVGTRQHPQLRPLLEGLEAPEGVTLAFGYDDPAAGGRDDWVPLSDQAWFHRAGVPFLFFSVEDHPDYHRPTDDADRIDAGWYAGAVQVAHDTLRAVDRDLERLFPAPESSVAESPQAGGIR